MFGRAVMASRWLLVPDIGTAREILHRSQSIVAGGDRPQRVGVGEQVGLRSPARSARDDQRAVAHLEQARVGRLGERRRARPPRRAGRAGTGRRKLTKRRAGRGRAHSGGVDVVVRAPPPGTRTARAARARRSSARSGVRPAKTSARVCVQARAPRSVANVTVPRARPPRRARCLHGARDHGRRRRARAPARAASAAAARVQRRSSRSLVRSARYSAAGDRQRSAGRRRSAKKIGPSSTTR